MRDRRRAVTLVGAALLVAACGSGGSATTTTVAGPTTASAPATTLPPTTLAATTTSPPTTPAPTTTTVPRTTTTTRPPATTAPRPTTTKAPSVGGFAKVARPVPPAKTAPIDAAWVEPSGALGTDVADGVYWGSVDGTGQGAEPFVDLALTQAFFGDACIAALGADGCDNDYGVKEKPTGTLPAWVSSIRRASVAGVEDQQSYAVTGAELLALVQGTPVAGQPAGFSYAPFPYLVTVQRGRIVELEQVWVP